MKNQTRNYWNPYVESMSKEEMLGIELRRLRNLVSYAKSNSDFYRTRYHDIDPEDIKTMEDVRKLPLIDKEDLRQSQEETKPFPFGTIAGYPRKT